MKSFIGIGRRSRVFLRQAFDLRKQKSKTKPIINLFLRASLLPFRIFHYSANTFHFLFVALGKLFKPLPLSETRDQCRIPTFKATERLPHSCSDIF